jgi:hypothetical protein
MNHLKIPDDRQLNIFFWVMQAADIPEQGGGTCGKAANYSLRPSNWSSRAAKLLSPSTTLFRRLIQFKEVKFKLLLFSLARD